jgi:hypothetical protein
MIQDPAQRDQSPLGRVEQMGILASIIGAAYATARWIVTHIMPLVSLQEIAAALLTLVIMLGVIAGLWLLTIVSTG